MAGCSRQSVQNEADAATVDEGGDLNWVFSLGGDDYHVDGDYYTRGDRGYIVRPNGDDGFVVAGMFHTQAVFGENQPNETTIHATDGEGCIDMFVARYRLNGVFDWVISAGGTDPPDEAPDYVTDISTLPDGSIVFTGGFADGAVFGRDEENETTLHREDGFQYLAKLDKNGELQWAKTLPSACSSPEASRACGVTSTGDGDLIISSIFSNEIEAEKIDGEKIVLTSLGYGDFFLARYNSSGDLLWVKRDGGSGEDRLSQMAVCPQGFVGIVGSFEGTTTFDSGEPGETLFQKGGMHLIVAKYNLDGKFIWAKMIANAGDNSGSIACDPEGALIVAGSSSSSFTVEPDTADEQEIPVDGTVAFWVKYASSGQVDWVTYTRGEGGASPLGVATSFDGSVFSNGFTNGGSTIWGQGKDETEIPECEGSACSRVFVVKYNKDGDLEWINAGSSGPPHEYFEAGDIAVMGGDENIVGIGTYKGKYVFGEGEDSETILGQDSAEGEINIFVMNSHNFPG